MERVKLSGQKREKENLHALRQSGQVPAVLYGADRPPSSLSVSQRTLSDLHKTHEGFNFMVDLSIGDGKEIVTLIRDYQLDPVKRHFVHVDFQEVNLKKKITVDVPIHFEGEAVGLKEGGVLDIKRRSLKVKCLPTEVPGFIAVNVAHLNIGDNLHINDVKLPERVECPHEVNYAIVSVVPPSKEELPTAPVAASAEVPATAQGLAEPAPAATGGKEGAKGAAAGKEAKTPAPAAKEGEGGKKKE